MRNRATRPRVQGAGVTGSEPLVGLPTTLALAWYILPRAVYSGGNDVQLLRGGDALFQAMREAISGARHEVLLATYIFHDDATALTIADALGKAAERGVRVRVVVDGFGSNATLGALQNRLGAAALAVFRPVHGWRSWLQSGQLRRLHQKLCVVDGEVAFVGGINVIDDRLDLQHGWSEAPRLDYAVRLRGPVVAPIEQTARAVWTRAWFGRDWQDELVTLARTRQPLAKVKKLLRDLRMSDARPRGSAGAGGPDVAQPPVRAAFVVRDNLRQRRTIERSYIDAIRRARESVDLVTPYFYPGRAFRRALWSAAGRGVRVRLLTQGIWDYRFAALAARALYEELLGRGVRIYEYTPAFLHAKVAVVDALWATVGSSNIDPLSLLVNLEANAMVHDRSFALELGQELEAAFTASREVTVAQTRGRLGLLHRAFVAWCARLYLRVAGATGRY
jgi:cardiolipin synthase A/B